MQSTFKQTPYCFVSTCHLANIWNLIPLFTGVYEYRSGHVRHHYRPRHPESINHVGKISIVCVLPQSLK